MTDAARPLSGVCEKSHYVANDSGQLGNGTTTPINEAEHAETANRWMDVSSGARHACAVDQAGGLYCWGDVNSENIT